MTDRQLRPPRMREACAARARRTCADVSPDGLNTLTNPSGAASMRAPASATARLQAFGFERLAHRLDRVATRTRRTSARTPRSGRRRRAAPAAACTLTAPVLRKLTRTSPSYALNSAATSTPSTARKCCTISSVSSPSAPDARQHRIVDDRPAVAPAFLETARCRAPRRAASSPRSACWRRSRW